MTRRERVLKALNHNEPDMVPLSIGSTSNDGFTKVAMRKFGKYLEIDNYDETITWKALQTVRTPSVIQDIYNSDFRTVTLKSPEKSPIVVEYSDGSYRDDFGVLMKPSEYYFDPMDRPLGGLITIDDINKYPWPIPFDKGRTEGLREEVSNIYYNTDYAIVADFLAFGPFEGALWIRGWEDFLSDLYTDPMLAEALMEKILEYDLVMWGQLLDSVGDFIHVVCQGDDLAMQDRTIISPAIYKNIIKKYHKQLYSFIKSKTKAKIMHHSCGSIYEIIPDLIDIGVDILNPIQTSAKHMEPERLKKEFGEDLCFWGGLDVQRILAFGTPSEIEFEVKKLMEVFGHNGGYVFAPSHNVQPTVPVENMKAMFEAALKYRKLS